MKIYFPILHEKSLNLIADRDVTGQICQILDKIIILREFINTYSILVRYDRSVTFF